jgi:hypothetical protein
MDCQFPVLPLQQKPLFRHGAGALQRHLAAAWILLFLARAAGQEAGTPAATNQPPTQGVATNAAPTGTTEAPATPEVATNQFPAEALTNGFQERNPLLYQIGVKPTPAPVVGPAAVGAEAPPPPLVGTSVFGGVPGAQAAAIPLGPGIPVWGPVKLHPSFAYSLFAGTGIESLPGQQGNIIVQTVAAGLLFDLGSHWRLDYSPTYTIYANPAYRDTLAHSAVLTGGTTYEDWAFSFSQTYLKSDEPLVETGMQTREEAFGTTLSAVYQMSSKLSLNMGAQQLLRETSQFNNVDSWTGNAGLNYQFIPQLGMGLELGGGYNAVSPGPSMPFETVEGTLNFRPGPKLMLTLSGGAEDLQFVDPSAPSIVEPIFSAALGYEPFFGTALSLTASRSVSPSFFGNNYEVATRLGGSIRQRLSHKWSLILNGGYTTEPVTTIVPGPLPQYFFGVPPPRSFLTETEAENATSFSARLSYAFVRQGAFTIFYTTTRNSSGQSNFAFSSTQYGFSIGYRY